MYVKTHNDVSETARERLGEILNHALADEFALSAAARDYHWNVTGPHYRSLQEFFDEQYRQIDAWIEKIGERARALGVVARAGWAELIKAPRFTPARGADLTAPCMMTTLATLHEHMAERLREDCAACADEGGDAVTAELLRELIEFHETAAWMLGELLEDRELARA